MKSLVVELCRRRPVVLALACFAALVAAPWPVRPALASDANGIYACVEQVIVEEAPSGPPSARVYGVFALAIRPEAQQPGGYTDPAAGYMYWRCAADKVDACRLEWRDLARAVGSGKCAAFGQRPPWPETSSELLGRLRPYSEAPRDPDAYPLAYGVSLVEAGPMPTPGQAPAFGAICALAKAFRLTATAPPPVASAAPGATAAVPTDEPTASPPSTSEPTTTALPTNAQPEGGTQVVTKQTPAAAFMPQAGDKDGRGEAAGQASLAGGAAGSSRGSRESGPGRAAWWGASAALALGAATWWVWQRRRGR